ncbi:MAG: 16S rRNA (cytosine(1402)-N(4))-methyltransferase, partial [Acidimicrobiales bacterium]|nr:16S rRNA (cytosine(1402)-N(4))-methyltransferase [Acidimicrobiales bacterium]
MSEKERPVSEPSPTAGHIPVLLDRVLELLAPALSGGPRIVVDATLGLGGHSAALLAAHPELTLVGLDRDPNALALAGIRLAEYADRTHLVHA